MTRKATTVYEELTPEHAQEVIRKLELLEGTIHGYKHCAIVKDNAVVALHLNAAEEHVALAVERIEKWLKEQR